MSIGMVLLVVIALLILFGVLQRVLDRMALTDRQALACVALAVTLVAAGFGACCLPVTTQLLSQATSNFEDTPYAPAQLTALAVATRDFTVDDYGRSALGTQGAQDVLAQRILDAAREASGEQSPVRGRWSQAARDVVENPPSASPAQVAFTALAGVGDAYALDRDAVSHLEDCNRLVRTAVPMLWGAAALAAALLIALVATGRRRAAGGALTVAPAVLVVALAAAGLWAALDFNGLFAAFHGVFFPQGNWTFGIDSLLICMYPLGFWMGMGAVWLVTTLVACIICLAAGRRLRKGR